MKIDTWECDQVCASGFSLARKACYVTVENHDKSAKFGEDELDEKRLDQLLPLVENHCF